MKNILHVTGRRLRAITNAIVKHSERIRDFMAPIVFSYAVVVIAGTVFAQVNAPQSTLSQLNDLRDRMDIEHRLTVVETAQKEIADQFFWSRIGTGGTGLLLLERCLAVLKKGIQRGNEA